MKKKKSFPVLFSRDTSLALYENPVCSELVRRGLDDLEPQNAEAWFKKGENFRMLGDNKNAIHCYEKALEFNNEYGSALFWEGFCWLHDACECFKNDPKTEHRSCIQNADAVYRRLISLHGKTERPSYAPDFNNYACARSRLGFNDDALEFFKKAVTADDSYYTAWANLGSSYHDRKQYDEAKKCLDKSLALREENPEAYYNYGCLYSGLGEYEKMAKSFEKYLEYIDHSLARNAKGIEFAKNKIAEQGKLKIRTGAPA